MCIDARRRGPHTTQEYLSIFIHDNIVKPFKFFQLGGVGPKLNVLTVA